MNKYQVLSGLKDELVPTNSENKKSQNSHSQFISQKNKKKISILSYVGAVWLSQDSQPETDYNGYDNGDFYSV